MRKQVPFINRKDEMKQMKKLAEEWGARRILCINAGGGIGKTRLLQEIHRKCAKNGLKFPTIATGIIDFDDHTFQNASNLGNKIAEMLNKDVFAPFFEILKDLRKMRNAGIRPKTLEEKERESFKCFADCFNEIGSEKRIILFMDTTDALDGTDIHDYLASILPLLENMLLIIAGRNAGEVGKYIENKIQEKLLVLDLPAFRREDSKEYLLRKQEIAHVSLDKKLAENLIVFAEGRPVLLDLAVEWRKREIPLKWLAEMEAKQLEAMSGNERQKKVTEFERHLVSHIAETRQGTDWLILLMAVVYPLDVEMVSELLNVKPKEGENLFKEAGKFVFVKHLPDGRITLHDEMRRMVEKHVWPEVDPDNDRRRDYLSREIEFLSGRIDRFENRKTTGEGVPGELNDYRTRESLELTRWRFKKNLLEHIPSSNISEIVKTLIDLFDETTRRYRFSLRETLMKKMDECIGKLAPDRKNEKYDLNRRKMIYLHDIGEYKKACDLASAILDGKEELTPDQNVEMTMQSGNLKIILGEIKEGFADFVNSRNLITEILKGENVLPEKQVDFLIQSGNIEIRLGNLKQGISSFENAVSISEKNDLKSGLVWSLNARGWAFRNLGDFDRALANYLKAYKLSIAIQDKKQTAMIFNNMAYIYAQKGRFATALGNCRSAEKLNEELGFRRELGMTFSSTGRVYDLSGQPGFAMDYFQKAMDIFQNENDVEWISNVRCNRGSIFLTQGKLDDALDDLDWASEHGPRHLITRILCLRSNYHKMRNELTEAKQKLEECRQVSRSMGDDFFDYVSFSRLVELAVEFDEYDRWEEYKNELEKSYSDRKSEMDLRLRGTSLRGIGDLAVCNGNFDSALNVYKEGFSLISEYENLPKYTVGEHIRKTEGLITKRVEKRVLKRLGAALGEFWANEETLMEKSPESLFIFQRWEQ